MGYDYTIPDMPGDDGYFRLAQWAALDVIYPAMSDSGMLVEAHEHGDIDEETGRTVGFESGVLGLPTFKLMPNQNWLVTPTEIKAALRTYGAAWTFIDEIVREQIASAVDAPATHAAAVAALTADFPPGTGFVSGLQMIIDDEGRDAAAAWLWKRWHQWLDFLRLAADHGGMNVG